MKRQRSAVFASVCLVLSLGAAGCGSGSSDGQADISSRPEAKSVSPSPSQSKSSTPSTSQGSPSSTPSKTVNATQTIPVDLASRFLFVGDWIVGVPTEKSAGGSASFRLKGFNWRTGQVWDTTPLVGLTPARNAGSVPQLAQTDGTVQFIYESAVKGEGLQADEYSPVLVVLDPTDGRVVSNCSPDSKMAVLESVDAGPALLVYNGFTRLDAETCAPMWPAPSQSGRLFASTGEIIVTEEIGALDAATGAALWNEETADFPSYINQIIGLSGPVLVLRESEAITFRDVATGELRGNSVAWTEQNSLDSALGLVYTFGDGTLTAYDTAGAQVWQRTGLDAGARLTASCFGRLWVTDSRTRDIFLLDGATGSEVLPNSEAPRYCLDDSTGIYAESGYSSAYFVSPLPPIEPESEGGGSASPGSQAPSGAASPTASVSRSGTEKGSPSAADESKN